MNSKVRKPLELLYHELGTQESLRALHSIAAAQSGYLLPSKLPARHNYRNASRHTVAEPGLASNSQAKLSLVSSSSRAINLWGCLHWSIWFAVEEVQCSSSFGDAELDE